MRSVDSKLIADEIYKAVGEIAFELSKDVGTAIASGAQSCEGNCGDILDILVKNSEIASRERIPLCQDTGMSVVFLEIGNECHISGKFIEEAINESVAKAYEDFYLRKSVVENPLRRINTGNNAPAVIHYSFSKGDKIRIKVALKGFGSENMSATRMLKPSDGYQGVLDFALETVRNAGPNACPPLVVGVGIGGTLEKAAILSKEALMRSIDSKNPDETMQRLEAELLEKINELGIGPMGMGGSITALGVNVEFYPTHIAGLPVSVNINCHSSRHKEIVI